MKFKNKKELFLRLLYENRKGRNFHSPYDLLKKQGVNIDHDESFDIAYALDDEGLIQSATTKDDAAAIINARGIEWVEDHLDIEAYYTASERKTLIDKLDEFGGKLDKLALGQDIIHTDITEELEHLKSLLTKLQKKDWVNLFKGALISHGLGKIAPIVEGLLLEVFKDQGLLPG